MRYYELSFIVTLVILLCCAAAALVSVETTGKHDQPIEQAAEAILKQITGISIDFTPDVPANVPEKA